MQFASLFLINPWGLRGGTEKNSCFQKNTNLEERLVFQHREKCPVCGGKKNSEVEYVFHFLTGVFNYLEAFPENLEE